MWFNICFLVAVFAARCEAGTVQNNKQKLIYGGTPLPITEAPYMAQYAGGMYFCGAIIIHKNFVISAAHCYMPADKKHILVGSDKMNEGQQYDIQETVIHPEYNKSIKWNYDVAVIMLSKSLQYSDRVRPIMMATEHLALKSGDLLTVMGFGDTEKEGILVSPNLLSVKMPYVTNKECNERVIDPVIETMICAGGVKGKSSCHGDSGGPLVYNDLLVGIVSYGYECGETSPRVFTRVSAVHDFIITTIHKLSKKTNTWKLLQNITKKL